MEITSHGASSFQAPGCKEARAPSQFCNKALDTGSGGRPLVMRASGVTAKDVSHAPISGYDVKRLVEPVKCHIKRYPIEREATDTERAGRVGHVTQSFSALPLLELREKRAHRRCPRGS